MTRRIAIPGGAGCDGNILARRHTAECGGQCHQPEEEPVCLGAQNSIPIIKFVCPALRLPLSIANVWSLRYSVENNKFDRGR